MLRDVFDVLTFVCVGCIYVAIITFLFHKFSNFIHWMVTEIREWHQEKIDKK